MKYAMIGLLVLTGCKAEVPTATTESRETVTAVDGEAGPKGEKGLSGDAGPVGPTGAAGPIGPKGDQGVAAPTFKLRDRAGNTLPGTYVGNGTLFSEEENTIVTYNCAIAGTCGMTDIPAVFQSTNCTGQPFVNPTEFGRVFTHKGAAWVISNDPSNLILITTHSFSDGEGGCSNSSTTKTLYMAISYTGNFPLAPVGPYTVTKE